VTRYAIRLNLDCGKEATVIWTEAFPPGYRMHGTPHTAGCDRSPASCEHAKPRAMIMRGSDRSSGWITSYNCPGEVVSAEETQHE